MDDMIHHTLLFLEGLLLDCASISNCVTLHGTIIWLSARILEGSRRGLMEITTRKNTP